MHFKKDLELNLSAYRENMEIIDDRQDREVSRQVDEREGERGGRREGRSKGGSDYITTGRKEIYNFTKNVIQD